MIDLSKYECTFLRAKTHSAQIGGRGTVSVFETRPAIAAHACEIHMTAAENFLVKLPGPSGEVLFIPGGDVAHARFRPLTTGELLEKKPEPKIIERAGAHEAKKADDQSPVLALQTNTSADHPAYPRPGEIEAPAEQPRPKRKPPKGGTEPAL